MASKVSATVKYHKKGTQPPVYIAGSFSNPEWQPTEMEHTVAEDNELDFHSEVQVEEGREYQYKFRIGEGDWWVLNENSPSGTDNAGNRNNILIVPVSKPAPAEESADTKTEDKTPVPPVAAMDDHSGALEERMGTRESSDVLFDDEIVKEDDKSTSHTYVPVNGHENWSPPSPSKPAAAKTSDKIGYLALMDGAGPEASEDGGLERALQGAAETHKGSDERKKDAAEEKEITSNGSAHDTNFTHADISVEEVSTDKDLKSDSLTKKDGAIPSLSIKGIDAEGDDSAGATLSEPEQGSEPGYVMVEDRALTPDVANTAAEVADSAATLDPREPTPPISDEEAGRTGYRRMSNTPIPQVAATAAEVADVAKNLDNEDSMESARQQFKAGLGLEQQDDYPETPEDEKVRRLPEEGTWSDSDNDDDAQNKPSISSLYEHVRSPTMAHQATPEEIANLPMLNIVPIPAGEDHDMTILSDIQEESILEHEELPLPPTTIEPLNSEAEQMDSGADAANDTRSKKQVRMNSPLTLPSLNATPVLPATPFIRSDGQLGKEVEESAQSSRAIGGPSINVTPATPRGSSMYDPMEDSDSRSPDTAKSTAVEEKSNLIRARKSNASPAPAADRPLTPNSVRSAGKEAHERNFLKTFWRVLFVDWIGGFLLRLCGGDRRRTA